MRQFVDSSSPPPEIRNQQVPRSSRGVGLLPSHTEHATYSPFERLRNTLRTGQGAYRVAYRWLLRLIGRSPVAHLGTPDDLATEQRIADLTRRMRG